VLQNELVYRQHFTVAYYPVLTTLAKGKLCPIGSLDSYVPYQLGLSTLGSN